MIMQKLANAARRFAKKEDGLVTVEWVAICAAIVVGGIALAWQVQEQLDPVSATIGQNVTNAAGSITSAPTAAGAGVGDGQ